MVDACRCCLHWSSVYGRVPSRHLDGTRVGAALLCLMYECRKYEVHKKLGRWRWCFTFSPRLHLGLPDLKQVGFTLNQERIQEVVSVRNPRSLFGGSLNCRKRESAGGGGGCNKFSPLKIRVCVCVRGVVLPCLRAGTTSYRPTMFPMYSHLLTVINDRSLCISFSKLRSSRLHSLLIYTSW